MTNKIFILHNDDKTKFIKVESQLEVRGHCLLHSKLYSQFAIDRCKDFPNTNGIFYFCFSLPNEDPNRLNAIYSKILENPTENNYLRIANFVAYVVDDKVYVIKSRYHMNAIIVEDARIFNRIENAITIGDSKFLFFRYSLSEEDALIYKAFGFELHKSDVSDLCTCTAEEITIASKKIVNNNEDDDFFKEMLK